MSRDKLSIVDYSRGAVMESDLPTLQRGSTSHIVIGCGGIGFWIGLLLAMLGHERFILIDGDAIDETNLARLLVPQTWVGVNKTVALRRLIWQLRPEAVVTCMSAHYDEHTMSLLKKTVSDEANAYSNIHFWDMTDDARVQLETYKQFKKLKQELEVTVGSMHYRKAGYNGWNVGSYDTISFFGGLPEDYRPGYTVNNANVLSSVVAAATAILASGCGASDVNIDLKELLTFGGFTNRTRKEYETGQEVVRDRKKRRKARARSKSVNK